MGSRVSGGAHFIQFIARSSSKIVYVKLNPALIPSFRKQQWKLPQVQDSVSEVSKPAANAVYRGKPVVLGQRP